MEKNPYSWMDVPEEGAEEEKYIKAIGEIGKILDRFDRDGAAYLLGSLIPTYCVARKIESEAFVADVAMQVSYCVAALKREGRL